MIAIGEREVPSRTPSPRTTPVDASRGLARDATADTTQVSGNAPVQPALTRSLQRAVHDRAMRNEGAWHGLPSSATPVLHRKVKITSFKRAWLKKNEKLPPVPEDISAK